jgi:hypothetical protein
MGLGGALHYVGSFILFAAVILTVIIDISAPVVDSISMLKVDNGNNHAKFGVFGWCTSGSGQNTCSDSSIGYNPAKVLEQNNFADFSNAREDTTKALTNVFVLHPVGTGVAFLAFLLSLGSTSTALSILATLVTALAFVVNTVACIVSWVVFSLIRHEVNDDAAGSKAKYGPALYLAVVAAALCLLATVIMFVTCCAGRRRRRRESRKMMQGY